VLAFLDALGLCVLSHSEHLRSIRPSDIINAYLLLTVPFDIARIRTLWLNGQANSVAAAFSSAFAVKLLILIAEAVEKRPILLDRYRNSSPEFTSGLYSRSFFWWLNKLMTTGFRRVLTSEDLYPIDIDMSSEYLSEVSHKDWQNAKQARPRALVWSVMWSTRRTFLSAVFPRLCLIGFRYTRPFLLSRTVEFAATPDQPNSVGWGLAGAFFLAFLGQAVSSGYYYHMNYRFITKLRGSLVALVYGKTVDLSITALDESIAVTLMSSDTGQLFADLPSCQDVLTDVSRNHL
jgi:ATP-binding cassette subfamily C (CFTR/MRP) protein 1